MFDFGPDGSKGLRQFERNVRSTFEAVAVLQAQVAALTAYVAYLGSSARDEDILAFRGEAQIAVQYMSTPSGSPPARYASEYVDHIHALATKRTAGNEGAHG